MTSRREFLQIGITASAWPLASSAVRAAGAEPRGIERLPIYKIIYDERFAESIMFADRAAALGLRVHAIDGDMTRFWYDDLYHRWKQGPAAIAGLTAYGPMFCFEQLAQDQRMRIVFRAAHELGPVGRVQHEIEPLATLQQARALNGRPDDWPTRVADIVAHFPAGGAKKARTVPVSHARPGAADAQSLYSWVIAPAVGA